MFGTCFVFSLHADGADRKQVEFQKLYQALFSEHLKSQENRLMTETCSLQDRDRDET